MQARQDIFNKTGAALTSLQQGTALHFLRHLPCEEIVYNCLLYIFYGNLLHYVEHQKNGCRAGRVSNSVSAV